MAKPGQKPTDYVPNRTALRLLEALSDPASRMKSVTEICKVAKISRDTYYKLLKERGFVEVYREFSFDMVKHKIAQLINALLHQATRGSAQHLRMALEMAGLYVKKQKEELEIPGLAELLTEAIDRKKARDSASSRQEN